MQVGLDRSTVSQIECRMMVHKQRVRNDKQQHKELVGEDLKRGAVEICFMSGFI